MQEQIVKEERSILSFIPELILIFLLFFSPLFYGSVPALPLAIVEGLSFLLVFVFILFVAISGRISLINFPFWPLLLFLVFILFQIIPIQKELLAHISPATSAIYEEFSPSGLRGALTVSIYSESTVSMFLQCLAYLSVCFVVVNLIDSEIRIKRIAGLIVICGFAYSLYGIIRKITTPVLGFSTFANRNHFAAYMEMAIPLGIAMSLTRISQIKKILFVSMSAVMSIALFLSLSRAGALCLIFGLILFITAFLARRPSKKAVSMVLILLALLILFITVVGISTLGERLVTLRSPLQAGLGRLNVLRDAPKIIQDFPFWGTGLGTFMDIFPKYKSFDSGSSYRFAHNEPLQLLIETGVIGFMLIILFLLFYFLKIIFAWFKRKDDLAVYLTLGCIVGICSVVLHSFFEFFLHVPANALLFFIVLALAFKLVNARWQQGQWLCSNIDFSLSKTGGAILVTVSAIALFFIESLIIHRYQAEAFAKKVEEKKNVATTGMDAAFEYRRLINDIDKAIILNPENSAYISRKADLLSMVATRQDLKSQIAAFGEFRQQRELLDVAKGLYEKAILLNPTKAIYHLKLGWTYYNLGDVVLMQEEFKKASLLAPKDGEVIKYIKDFENKAKISAER